MEGTRTRRLLRWGRRLLVGVLGLGLLLGGLGWWISGPRWRGEVTEHFDGRRFSNAEGGLGHTDMWPVLRWMVSREPGEFPERAPLEAAVPAAEVEAGRVRVTFVGHSTLLIQSSGLNLLTDPIWSERASPVGFAGPRRKTAPGLALEALPDIDAVLISHNHYDHLDRASIRALHAEHAPRFFVPLGLAAQLAEWGVPGATELDWWESAQLDGRALHCLPVQHFSGRGPFDRDATLWCGWWIEDRAGGLYFGGDSGFGPHLAETARRLGAPRAAFLPIGAYLPRWFMAPVHMDPAEAVRAHRVLGATTSVAIHAGCFQLADDGREQAYEDLAAALEDQGVAAERFLTPRSGAVFELAPAEGGETRASPRSTSRPRPRD